MPPQQRQTTNSTINTANPMVGRLPNGRAAGVPSWGSSTSQAFSIQRPPSAEPRKTTQSFREDDFPALGATSEATNYTRPATETTDDFPALPGMINMQQHRNSLLGAMTGRPATQARTFNRAINAPPNLSLMSGPPALGGAVDHVEEPASARSTTYRGDLSVPVPSHAPGLQPQESRTGEEPLTETERYTIKGLLPIIRQLNPDASMLALGTDLTNLGLKLSPDDDRLLSSLWSSPWTDQANITPLPVSGWTVPSCYTGDMLGVLPPAKQKIGNFAEETLFYIFYTQPRDRLQEYAAQELTVRNWRFHKSLGLWLTKEPGVEPQLRTNAMERGTYVFWDSSRWERVKKVFELYYEDLEDRFSAVVASSMLEPQP